MTEKVEQGELRGGYAEDTQVASNLDQADFNDLMTRQLVQNNVSLQHQIQQATFENQQRMANAIQLFILNMTGKGAASFPKAIVENVETFSKTTADDNVEDSSTTVASGYVTVDQFSKVVDAIKQQASQQAAQQSQLTSSVESLLAKIDTMIK